MRLTIDILVHGRDGLKIESIDTIVFKASRIARADGSQDPAQVDVTAFIPKRFRNRIARLPDGCGIKYGWKSNGVLHTTARTAMGYNAEALAAWFATGKGKWCIKSAEDRAQ